MAEEKDLVVLDMSTPVARKPRRAAALSRPLRDYLVQQEWSEQARLRPVDVVLSPLNRKSQGLRGDAKNARKSQNNLEAKMQ